MPTEPPPDSDRALPAAPPPPERAPGGSSRAELPDAEIRRRRRDLLITLGVVVVFAAVFLVERRITSLPAALPFGDSFLFLFLNAVSVVLIVLLVYLIGRHFVKLVFERRSGTLGSHLNLKFVLALFLMAAVPTAVQYVISSRLIAASIGAWFGLQMDRAIDDSRDVADAYYDAWAGNALHYGEQIAQQITAQRLLREGERETLRAFVHEKQREYNLGVVQIFPFAESEPIATLVNPEVPAAAFVKRESAIVASAFAGDSASVVEAPGADVGDVIRGAVPILSSDPARKDEIVGAVVVNHLVPHSLVYKVGAIRSAVDEYRAIQPVTGQIAGVYQLVLLLFSLVVVLFALWWGLRMARGVTGPIRELAEGTQKVARGDLDVVVEETTDDEIGLLVRSFNRMTHDLREALQGLELSNTELDQRRRYMEIVLRNVGCGRGLPRRGGAHQHDQPRGAAAARGRTRRLGDRPQRSRRCGREPELSDAYRELASQTRAGIRESVRRQVVVAAGEEVLTLVVTLTVAAGRRGTPARLGHRVRRLHPGGAGPADGGMAGGGAPHRPRDQEPAHADPALGPAHPPPLRTAPRAEGEPDAGVRRVRRHHHEPGGGPQGPRERVLELRAPAQAAPARVISTQLVQEAVSSYAGTRRGRLRDSISTRRSRSGRRRSGAAPPGADEPDRERLRRRRRGAVGRRGRPCARCTMRRCRRRVSKSPTTGSASSPEDRRRIFEPYFSTKDHGTGLGLAIVSRIVADHHGYIRVHAGEPTGTRFIVELPVRSN